MKFKIGMLVGILISTSAISAPYTQDSGKISTMYVSASGSVAVKLDGGFPNASTDGQCPNLGAGAWAGNVAGDPILKSALLAAKAANQSVTVTVQGCEGGGAWFKIIDIYLN